MRCSVCAARAARDAEPAAWQDATGLVQSQVWLTAMDADALRRRMVALAVAYLDRSQKPELRPPDARLVSVTGWVAPSGPQRPGATTDVRWPGDAE